MRLILNESKLIAQWVGRHLGHGFDDCAAIGVATDTKLLAGAVYSNYRVFDVEFNIYSENPKWCTRNIIRELLRYPFITCGVERMNITLVKGDERTRRLANWIGFEEDGYRVRGYDGTRDAILMGILKEDVLKRWFSHGKETESAKSA